MKSPVYEFLGCVANLRRALPEGVSRGLCHAVLNRTAQPHASVYQEGRAGAVHLTGPWRIS